MECLGYIYTHRKKSHKKNRLFFYTWVYFLAVAPQFFWVFPGHLPPDHPRQESVTTPPPFRPSPNRGHLPPRLAPPRFPAKENKPKTTPGPNELKHKQKKIF